MGDAEKLLTLCTGARGWAYTRAYVARVDAKTVLSLPIYGCSQQADAPSPWNASTARGNNREPILHSINQLRGFGTMPPQYCCHPFS